MESDLLSFGKIDQFDIENFLKPWLERKKIQEENYI